MPTQESAATAPEPTVVRYRDGVTGFSGFLVLDGARNPLAAGGFRVQPGLTEETVVQLAQAMTLKQRLLGLGVDGAKCGIDYDPRAAGKHAAVRRFLRFLRPYLFERLSIGPDMGTTWSEVERIAREEDIGSVKIAVARAQGLSGADFRARLRVLDERVGVMTVGQRRSGHALAHAALAALKSTGVAGRPARVAVQGFGTLGRAAALSLAEAGVRVTVLADEHGCLRADAGVDLATLLGTPHGTPLTHCAGAADSVGPREVALEAPVDALLLAAHEDAVSRGRAADLAGRVRAVVVGANLGLARHVEEELHGRGVAVVPDFVAGCGGSASMDALFGPARRPSAPAVLQNLGASMQGLVHEVLDVSAEHGLVPRQGALAVCEQRPQVRPRPYGWPAPSTVSAASAAKERP